ncbi:hypothetical protein [Massilia putida]|uniref:hypothetical protein n=1 Tax=Massilia putida TaxID=1141883 RepID=UPI001C54D770|nr:hypothetical protein [Massilia putida]
MARPYRACRPAQYTVRQPHQSFVSWSMDDLACASACGGRQRSLPTGGAANGTPR